MMLKDPTPTPKEEKLVRGKKCGRYSFRVSKFRPKREYSAQHYAQIIAQAIRMPNDVTANHCARNLCSANKNANDVANQNLGPLNRAFQ